MANSGEVKRKEDEVGFLSAPKKKKHCNALFTTLRGLARFIYNPRTHLVMGRNCKEWMKLLAFYLVFYGCLVGFWIACLTGFLSTTDELLPKLTGFQSMLQLNPAMGYRPQPDYGSNLIKFVSSNASTYSDFTLDSNAFLQPYLNSTRQSQLLDCSTGLRANQTAACQYWPLKVAPRCFPESAPPYNFGFDTAKPCLILKLNRIVGWLPATLPNTTDQYSDLKIRCLGENQADTENIGTVEYYPGGVDEKGPYGLIKAAYFPFFNQPNYLSPLVFARFANIQRYTLALIWCTVDSEAMNFLPDIFFSSSMTTERSGGTHVELVVD